MSILSVFFMESTFFFFFYFTILYWFCHTSTWIHHRCTHVPHPEPPPSTHPVPSHWVIPVHQLQASCILHWTWTGDSLLIWYYTCFNAILPNHPLFPLPQSPKDCSKSLFYCWAIKSMMQMYHHLFIHSPVTGIRFASSFQLLWIKLLLWTFVCRFYVNASFNLLGINA